MFTEYPLPPTHDTDPPDLNILVPRAPESVFPFPLFTTSLHMLVQFSLSALVLYLLPRFRPVVKPPPREEQAARLLGQDLDDNSTVSKKPITGRWFYLTHIVPCGAATGIDIGLGNMSMRFITLTFYTMCKSSVLGFTLLFAFLFKLEKVTPKLCLIIATISIGVLMMAEGETSFSPLGFVLVMTAACSSGLRWALTNVLLVKHPWTSNCFSTVFFLSPVMFVIISFLALSFEGFADISAGLSRFVDTRGTALAIAALLFPGVLAFSMTVSEFAFLQRTSAVSLSIAGIFKEVVTFVAAYLIFGDTMTLVNLAGAVITIIAIIGYNMMRFGIQVPCLPTSKRKGQIFPE